jgi:heme-degrading monooxygenase HmoA
MIVRIVTARVPLQSAPQFHELLREQLPELHRHEGLVYAKLVRRVLGDEEEVMLIEEWADAHALYAWTGPDVERPRLPADAYRMLADVRITHHEALDLDPASVWPQYADLPVPEIPSEEAS